MGASTLGSRAIIGTFYNRLEQYLGSSWIDDVSMYFSSNQSSETYAWLGMAPKMREWVGARVADSLRENGMTITNVEYEATLNVLMSELRRDKTGQILIRIAEMADGTADHWTELLSTLITNGTSAECYDGQFFFDDNHSEGESGVQKNLLTTSEVPALVAASATVPTPTEASKAILGVIAYMMQYVDDKGNYMNSSAREFTVMTAPVLWTHLLPAMTNQLVGSGESNSLLNVANDQNFKIKIVANPRLAYTAQFVTFRTDAPTKALIRQEEVGVEIAAIAEGSEYAFDNKQYKYGVSATRAVGYGDWRYASYSTLATS